MSIFKSALAEGRSVKIERNGAFGIHVEVTHGEKSRATTLISADAPAVMLAIAESSGVMPADHRSFTAGTPEHLESIARDLAHYIEQRDRAAAREAEEAKRDTKEAADREALDAEAFELYKALNPLADARALGDLTPDGKSRYRRLALKAREMHGADK